MNQEGKLIHLLEDKFINETTKVHPHRFSQLENATINYYIAGS